MSKAILVIDDIPAYLFTEQLSIEYQLIYYPDGYLKELGIHGKQLLRPMPGKSCYSPFSSDVGNVKINNAFIDGYNACIDAILGGNNDR